METPSTSPLFDSLKRIEKELSELRLVLVKLHGSNLAKENPGSLRGFWRGVVLEEEDFAEAKASFPQKNL